MAVITILTSPFPEYIKNGKKVKQSFSCGKNCSYCPNEPEIKLNLLVKEVKDNKMRVFTNDSLKIIRVITYIEFKDKQYEVIQCNKF